MLENLTAIPLSNVGVASVAAITEKQSLDLESESKNIFKDMFNNDFNAGVELKGSPQAAKFGAAQSAVLELDVNQLGDKLQAYIAQLEEGSTLPISGNSLPVLPPEVGQLLRDMQQSLQAVSLEQSNGSSVEGLPVELKNVLNHLAAIAQQLNAIIDEVSVDEAPLAVDGLTLADQPLIKPSLQKVHDTVAKGDSEQINFALASRQLRDSTLPDQDTLQQQLSTLNDFIQNIQELIPDRVVGVGAEFALEPKAVVLPSTANATLPPASVASTHGAHSLPAQGALLESTIRRLEQVLSRIDTLAAQPQSDAKGLTPLLTRVIPSNSPVGSAKMSTQQNTPFFGLSSTVDSVETYTPQLLALTTTVQNNMQPQAAPINELAAQLSAQIQDAGFNLAAVNHTRTTQTATQPTATSAAQPFATQIGLPMNNTQWGDQFVQRVVWLAGQGIASAEIQLNPAELGPLQVRIESHEDSARVVFTAHNVSARDSIESNLPRLRDLFASQGLDLLEVDVESQDDRQSADADISHEGDQQQMTEEGERAAENVDLVAAVNDAIANPIVESLILDYGRVDAFA